MALKYVIISALCILQTMCHQCQWTNMRMKYNETWQALDGMGEDLTNKCLMFTDRSFQMTFRLPKHVFRESLLERDAMKTIQETFHQISKIFRKNLGAAAWDESRSESLYIHLHRVTTDLEECMRPMKKTGLKNHLKVKKYFRKIENYLKDWRYERCAWEMVKSKVKMLLPDVRRLMMKL